MVKKNHNCVKHLPKVKATQGADQQISHTVVNFTFVTPVVLSVQYVHHNIIPCRHKRPLLWQYLPPGIPTVPIPEGFLESRYTHITNMNKIHAVFSNIGHYGNNLKLSINKAISVTLGVTIKKHIPGPYTHIPDIHL